VAPFLLSFLPRPGVRALSWRGRIELTLLLVGVGVATSYLFQSSFRIEYLVLPLIAVAAWRFRLQGAAPAALMASIVATLAAVHGYGPFEDEGLLAKMVTLQAFNVSVSLASFLLAAFVDAREQKEEISRLYRSASLAIAAKTDAIDVAAHELGPPVAVLTSYLAVLYDGKLGPAPPRWNSILNVMADKAWQIDRIISDLQQAAKIEGNTHETKRDLLDLREVIQKAAARARPRAEMSGARILTRLGDDPVPVEADAGQVGRILDNLINNSLTYVVRAPRIALEARVEGDRAVVHVIDNGVGMSEDERSRMFQPFHRTSDPTFSEVPGVGLGLYTSRQLAEANQGTLTLLTTQPGRGTSFALELPLSKAKPSPPAAAPATLRDPHHKPQLE
jgi:signal transduction histidine kinase